MLRRTSGIELPKDHADYFKITEDLQRRFAGYIGDSKEITFFEDRGDHILIPRFYPVEDDVYDDIDEGVDININSNFIARNTAQQKAVDFLINNYCGVLQLEPGRGKTVITIAAISKLKKKAIIITHKDSLLDNWKKEFLEHTDLKEDDIVRLSSSKYKKQLDKSIILTTPHVIAHAYKSNKTEFIEALNSCGIGFAVIDEAHVGIGPEMFSKSSIVLKSKRFYGLTATPKRFDGNEDLISYHLGCVNYIEPGDDELITPTVYMIKFPFGIYQGKTTRYLEWGGKFSYARYYNLSLKSKQYIDTVCQLGKKAYDDGRTILILHYRIDVLVEIGLKLGVRKEDVGLFVPGSNSKQRLMVSDTDDLSRAFKEKRIVLSTYGACRDGNNRKELDFLIMSLPTSNIEQAIGRIQRFMEGKKKPIVLDLVDTQGPKVTNRSTGEETTQFINQSEKRKSFYLSKEWEFKEMNLRV